MFPTNSSILPKILFLTLYPSILSSYYSSSNSFFPPHRFENFGFSIRPSVYTPKYEIGGNTFLTSSSLYITPSLPSSNNSNYTNQTKMGFLISEKTLNVNSNSVSENSYFRNSNSFSLNFKLDLENKKNSYNSYKKYNFSKNNKKNFSSSDFFISFLITSETSLNALYLDLIDIKKNIFSSNNSKIEELSNITNKKIKDSVNYLEKVFSSLKRVKTGLILTFIKSSPTTLTPILSSITTTSSSNKEENKESKESKEEKKIESKILKEVEIEFLNSASISFSLSPSSNSNNNSLFINSKESVRSDIKKDLFKNSSSLRLSIIGLTNKSNNNFSNQFSKKSYSYDYLNESSDSEVIEGMKLTSLTLLTSSSSSSSSSSSYNSENLNLKNSEKNNLNTELNKNKNNKSKYSISKNNILYNSSSFSKRSSFLSSLSLFLFILSSILKIISYIALSLNILSIRNYSKKRILDEVKKENLKKEINKTLKLDFFLNFLILFFCFLFKKMNLSFFLLLILSLIKVERVMRGKWFIKEDLKDEYGGLREGGMGGIYVVMGVVGVWEMIDGIRKW